MYIPVQIANQNTITDTYILAFTEQKERNKND